MVLVFVVSWARQEMESECERGRYLPQFAHKSVPKKSLHVISNALIHCGRRPLDLFGQKQLTDKKHSSLSRLTYQQSLCGTGHIVRIIISAIRNLTMQVGAISHSISDLEGCTGSGSEARANPSPLSACTPTDKFAKCELRVQCSPSKGRRDALALPIISHPPSSEWPRRGVAYSFPPLP